MTGRYVIRTTLTNEDEGYRFSDFEDEVPEHLLKDDGTPDFGAIYRDAQAEYGRCQSSVYVDHPGPESRRIGWFFVSRQQYEDTREPYLRGAWVTVYELVEPARPAVYTPVEVSR